ncbi:MAG: pyruvate kinase [Alphaproteobacteria bacterium]|nr:pyruvate kinase [Alphaproteobacteria bacterium]
MQRQRRAKIIATLGPTSSSESIISNLFQTGADVFRLNFSHGTQTDHENKIKILRHIEKQFNHPISIIADMQGPKLRIGEFENNYIELKKGQSFILDSKNDLGNDQRVYFPHPNIIKILQPNTLLLLDDGKIHLTVIKTENNCIETIVKIGGKLSSKKGVNIPSVILPIPSLTEKDLSDLHFSLNHDVDWVALSFVQKPEDVIEARKIINNRAGIIVKLEKPSAAIEHLDEIIKLTDAVMIARGDLGVEMPPENVPPIQKSIIQLCRKAGKPVIVATQMLESMINSPTPTRAEASDVATAIYDGADAVMLSAESASGLYPIDAVNMMDRIIKKIEQDPLYWKILDAQHQTPEATSSDAITAAAAQVTHTISAKIIVTYTTSGSTTLRAARERPEAPILCLTSNKKTARRLNMVWGTYCVETEDVKNFSEMVIKACDIAQQHKLVNKGDKIVITAGVPFGTPGATNSLRIATI